MELEASSEETTSPQSGVIANDVEIDFDRNLLIGEDGNSVRIEPRPMDLLRLFVRENGNVLTREAIISEIWDGAYGADQSLTNAVSLLRKSLRECATRPPVIETIPKRGYVFSAQLRRRERSAHSRAPGRPGALSGNRRTLAAVIGALAVGISTLISLLTARDVNDAHLADSNTIAVLPFTDVTVESGRSLFADEIAEAVQRQIGRSNDLAVIGPLSASQYADDGYALHDVAEQLGVSHILEGRVSRTDNNVRVSVNLLEAPSGRLKWRGDFQEPYLELSTLERTIAEFVADQFNTTLPFSGEPQSIPASTVFDAYLEARNLVTTRRLEDVRAAVNLLQWVVRTDPMFAAGYAQLAYSQNVLGTLTDLTGAQAASLRRQINQNADRALELDDRNELALTAKAITAFYQGEFAVAEGYFRRVIDANPNASEAYNWYGDMLGVLDRRAEQVRMEARAARLDPLLISNQYNLAQAYGITGELDGALRTIERALEIDPVHPIALGVKTYLLHRAGEANALMALRAEVDKLPLSEREQSGLNRKHYLSTAIDAFVADLKEDRELAKRTIDRYAADPRSGVNPALIAAMLARLEFYDDAALWLADSEGATYLTHNPFYFPTDGEILRKFPHYAAYWDGETTKSLLEFRRQFRAAATSSTVDSDGR